MKNTALFALLFVAGLNLQAEEVKQETKKVEVKEEVKKVVEATPAETTTEATETSDNK